MAFQLPSLPSFNVQIPDLQQKALEGAQLKNMLSEMALRKALAPLQIQQAQQGVLQAQQQVQSATTENEMKTMQLQGQRAMTDWLANGDASADVPAENFSHNDRIATFVGVTPNDPIMNVIRSMAQHHVPAPMLVTEAQGMLQRRNEYFKGTKEEQDAQKNERLIWQQALAEIHEAPEDQRSALLAAKLPLLQENSKTDPLLGAYAKGLAGNPHLIDQAYNTISAENAALGLRKAKAEAASAEQKQQQEKINPQTGLSPQLAAEANKEVAVAKATMPEKLLLAKAEEETRLRLQAGGVGAIPLNPAQSATALAIVEGRQTAPSGYALSTPYWQAVMGGVAQLDPQWNEQRAELRKNFTVGSGSKEINAINTAMGHVGVLGDAIDALNNPQTGSKTLNAIANRLGLEVGKDNVTTFNTIVHRVGPELSKAYLGAGGSAGERGADEKDFDPSLGPQQLKSNVAVTAQLLRSKIGALENQWNQNKSDSMPAFQDRFISPEAQQQLNRWSPQGGGGGGAETKTFQGHTYTRSKPTDPWKLQQ